MYVLMELFKERELPSKIGRILLFRLALHSPVSMLFPYINVFNVQFHRLINKTLFWLPLVRQDDVFILQDSSPVLKHLQCHVRQDTTRGVTRSYEKAPGIPGHKCLLCAYEDG